MQRTVLIRVVLLVAIALIGGVAVPSASAALIVAGVSNTGTENVEFNISGLLDDATIIQGVTNQTGTIVTFSGDGIDVLTTPSGGQARIEAFDECLNFLKIEILGGTFSKLVLNLNAEEDGFVTFTTDEVGLAPVIETALGIDGAGENFFTITITSLVGFESISLLTDVCLQDVRQIRLGGAAGGTVVPELSSLAAWGVCLAGAGLVAYRRNRRRGMTV